MKPPVLTPHIATTWKSNLQKVIYIMVTSLKIYTTNLLKILPHQMMTN